MASEAGLLDDFDKEIQETSASISRKISALKTTEKSRDLINEIKDELDQCRVSVRNMELEIRGLDNNAKSKWQDRINRYKTDLKTLQRDFDRDKEIAQRNDLFSGSGRLSSNASGTEEEQRLVATVDRAREDNEILRQSARELNDTEKNAMEISEELVNQKGKINRIKGNLEEGNTVLGRVGRMLGRMRRRQVMMSLMWCFIIVIILLVIGLTVYFKSIKKN